MILVTGGAGFIGSVLVKELNKKGITDIVIVDRLAKSEKWKNLRGLKFSEYILADDFFELELDDLFEEFTSIYHMGACSSTTEKNVDYLMKNNVEFSRNIFTMACELGIPLVYASSAATYGDGKFGYSDDHKKIESLIPLNPYGFSKQVFDQWALEQRKRPPVWFGVKFFNVYGPNEYHKDGMYSVVYKAFKEIEESGRVKLFKSHRPDFKDGEQLRDFVYVKDVVRAMIELMNIKDERKSGIVNMGTGKARSFNDLVTATFKAMNKNVAIDYVDMPDHVRNQYQYFTEAKMEKFHSLVPNFVWSSLEDGVTDYVKNHLLLKK